MSAAFPPTPALPPAHVINLDRSPARWAQLMQHWPQDVPVARFTAVDGTAIADTHEIDGTKYVKPERLSRNEFACVLSHLSLWHLAARGDAPAIMVFEDDVLTAPDFTARCSAFMAALPADFDIAYLGYNHDMHVLLDMPGVGEIVMVSGNKRPTPEILWAPGQPQRACRVYRLWGTPAYVLSKQGAAKLLAHYAMAADTQYAQHYFALPNGLGGERGVYMPTEQADLRMLPLLPSLQAYVALPMLALADLDGASTINERGFDWHQPPA